MNVKNNYKAVFASLAISIAGVAVGHAEDKKVMVDSPESSFSTLVDAKGHISMPKDFRLTWTHIGSWALADGFHDVYTQKGSAEYYFEHGSFPDGAVLVKEVRGKSSGVKTTGQAQWSAGIIQWFVMVKDTKNRFPDNGLWADGWGWALFKPADTTKQLAKSYKADCMACHIPAAATDRVFIEGYPLLSERSKQKK